MSILETIRKQLNPVQKSKTTTMNFRSIDIAPNEVPNVIEKAGSDIVWYGETNLYPDQLFDLKYGSAVHNSILKTKSKMMAGSGLLYNGTKNKEESDAYYNSLQGTQKAELDYLLNNEIGGKTLDEIRTLLSQDYQDYGAYCYSIIYNKDFTKIAGIKYYKLSSIRAGKMDNDCVISSYYYSRNWDKSKTHQNKPSRIEAYSKGNKDAYEQMVYRKTGNLDYYGIPNYSGCLNWVYTDFQLSVFFRGLMENSMNPGLHFKFYKLPESPEQEEAILMNIDKQWKGAMKTGKKIVTFNEGKDLAMDIQPVEVSNLDKQLMLVAELCDQKILSGHQLTTPMLAGITSKNGFSNNGSELGIGYQLLDGLTIESDRLVLEKDHQWWFETNKIVTKVEIAKFKPFEEVPTQQPKFTITNG
jgi:hypothetical protein